MYLDWNYVALGAAAFTASSVLVLYQEKLIKHFDRAAYGIRVPDSSSPIGWRHGRAFSDDSEVLDERGPAKIRLVFNYERDKLPRLEEFNDSEALQNFFTPLDKQLENIPKPT